MKFPATRLFDREKKKLALFISRRSFDYRISFFEIQKINTSSMDKKVRIIKLYIMIEVRILIFLFWIYQFSITYNFVYLYNNITKKNLDSGFVCRLEK
jgi:hypothetical protein